MYASGVPLGLLTDARGPRLTTFIGAVALGIGYYPIYIGLSVWLSPALDNVCADLLLPL